MLFCDGLLRQLAHWLIVIIYTTRSLIPTRLSLYSFVVLFASIVFVLHRRESMSRIDADKNPLWLVVADA